MPGVHIRRWTVALRTTHTGHPAWRSWRPDDNQNRAYPSRQTVQLGGPPQTSRSRRLSRPISIGFFHIDIAEVQTAEGKVYLFVAIDRTSKFAFTELHVKATTRPQPTSCAPSSRRYPTRSISPIPRAIPGPQSRSAR